MKLPFFLIVILLFVGLAVALQTSITTFSNRLSTENLTFTPNANVTRFLSIPVNSFITNLSMNITIFDSPIESPSYIFNETTDQRFFQDLFVEDDGATDAAGVVFFDKVGLFNFTSKGECLTGIDGNCSNSSSDYAFLDNMETGVINTLWEGFTEVAEYSDEWGYIAGRSLKTIANGSSAGMSTAGNSRSNAMIAWLNISGNDSTSNRWLTLRDISNLRYCSIGINDDNFLHVGSQTVIRRSVNEFPVESNKSFQIMSQIQGNNCTFYARNDSADSWFFLENIGGLVNTNWTNVPEHMLYVNNWTVDGKRSIQTVDESQSANSNRFPDSNTFTVHWNVTTSPPGTSRWIGLRDTDTSTNICAMGVRSSSFLNIGTGSFASRDSSFPIFANEQFQTRIIMNGSHCIYYARNTTTEAFIELGNDTVSFSSFNSFFESAEGVTESDVVYWNELSADGIVSNLTIQIGDIDSTPESTLIGSPVGTSQISLNQSKVNQLLENCNCTSCTLQPTTCDIPLTFNSLTAGTIAYSAINLTYASSIGVCSDINFNHTILNMSYFDQLTNNSISPSNGFNFQFAGDFTHQLNGTFSGNPHDDICTDVNPALRNMTWAMTGASQLELSEYATKLLTWEVGGPLFVTNNPFTQLNNFLIRLNESSTVVFTWLTSSYAPIDGVMNIFQCAGDGTRTFIDAVPITDGIAAANLVLINQPYSYEIVTNGQTFTDATSYTKCHVETETTRRFLVQVEGIDVSPTIGMYSIGCNVTRTDNNTVSMSWGSNPKNTDDITGCIYSFRHSVAGTVNNYVNCSILENPLVRTIPNSGFDYSVKGRLFQSGFAVDCNDIVEFKQEQDSANLFGIAAVLGLFYLLCALALMFDTNSTLQILGVIIGLLVSFIFGFSGFGWQTTSSLVVFLIIILVIGRYNKKE